MICVTLHNKTYEEILSVLEDRTIEMAEIRLDLCPELTDGQIRDLFENSDTPLIATGRGDYRRLELAIEAGARFADLEIEAPVDVSRRVQKLCRECGTELIRSYHNFKETPSQEYLRQVMLRCFRYGADIAKIVTVCNSPEDAKSLEGLYAPVPGEEETDCRGHLIAFGMGENGRAGRLSCLKYGAPFTYAALSEEDAVSPGQWPLDEIRRRIPEVPSYHRQGLRMPASKSFAQRAILAAALAEGVSHLDGYTPCDDSESAVKVAEALGARVTGKGAVLEIEGIGARIKERPGLPEGSGLPLRIKSIDVGESGLLARLVIPLCSALNDGPFTVKGEKTLLSRPLAGAVNIMASFGVILANEKGAAGREVTVPVQVKGNIVPGVADVSGKGGSQLISGLMMALPLCSKPSTLYVGEPKSIPYMYITQDVLGRFGIRLTCEMEGDAEMLANQDWSCCTGMTFRINGRQRYVAADFPIESDWSAAAVLMVAGAVFGSVELQGLDTSSVQADISIMDILVDAGAVVSVTEQDSSVCVRKAPLEAFSADLNHCPDLFPVVSVLAAFCAGRSTLSGIARLSGKESNRAEAILEMLSALGVNASVVEDELIVEGEQLTSRVMNGRLLKGGYFTTRHDHRMVMALAVASLGADSPITVDDADCVAKSFPGFFTTADIKTIGQK